MRASRFRVRLVSLVLAAYVGLVAVITLTPTHFDRPFGPYIDKLLVKLHEHGLPQWFGYGDVQFLANVAMFLPLGFLAALLLPRKAWWVLLFLGTAFSSAIEFAQSLYLPARYSDPLDVVANSLGALVGAVIAITLRLLVSHRDRLVERDNVDVGTRRYSVD
jgi:glycopeptide antibiotics resistance protein